jgi:GTP cyclohydrolase I
MDRALIELGAHTLLKGLGVDTTDHNFATTPKRMADVFEEVFCPKSTGWPVFDEEYTDIVILRGHTFYTFCPHHLLPVRIVASVAYFPDGMVIGASKLARLIHEVNTSPLTQEKLTDLICHAIKEYTKGSSQGEAVYLTGAHGCFQMRGIKSEADMLTYKFSGCFEESENQRRFIQLVESAHRR